MDIVGAWLLYTAVKLAMGSVRGQPYPDPAPITPFSVTYVLYLLLSIALLHRNTVGERLHSILPVTMDGKALSRSYGLLRLFLVSFFWAGWILFDTSPGNIPRSLVMIEAGVLAAIMLYGFVDVVLVFTHRTPRTLTDRILRIAVVYLPPVQPHRAPAGPMYSPTDGEFGRPSNHKEDAKCVTTSA